MNANLIAAIRLAVEQALAEKDLPTREDVEQIVAARVAAELGTDGLDGAAIPAVTSAPATPKAQTASAGGRKPAQSQDERRRKRAEYQKVYRAREKAQKDGTPVPEVKAATKAPTIAPEPKAPTPAPAPEVKAAPEPKKDNGASKATIAYVPDVSLDV